MFKTQVERKKKSANSLPVTLNTLGKYKENFHFSLLLGKFLAVWKVVTFQDCKTRRVRKITESIPSGYCSAAASRLLRGRRRRFSRDLPFTDKGQVILEFTFCMVIVLLMIFGITKVFTWSGREFAGRSAAHDSTLYLSIDRDYGSIGDGPLKQIDPYFYTPVKMNAIWKGN